MELKEGIYENLISIGLQNDMNNAETEHDMRCDTAPMDSADVPDMLSHYLADAVRRNLEDRDDEDDCLNYINKLLETADADGEERIENLENILTCVRTHKETIVAEKTNTEEIRPLSGFRVSSLFTGGSSGIPINAEILRDITSSDEICIIVSFLKLSGIRIFMPTLRTFCENAGHKLRIITTTYCGITEAKAVKQLSELPNTEIRISYNTTIERLHAKSYIFKRNSGYDTAYVGSSNLSHSALTDGLEWNIRVTNIENPHIIKSAYATFEKYWNSNNFEDFKTGGIDKFNKELGKAKQPKLSIRVKYNLLPHQKMILDRLRVEREENGNYRNLIVAATGTGKTVISAFDYKDFKYHNPSARLLFVAHREEILKQSIITFQNVIDDYNFGELWVGDNSPSDNLDNLFVSVQTFNSQFETFRVLGADYYDYIVIDEAHHSQADSYRKIVDFFSPKILLGLTATPERMDGQSLLPDFGNRISAEIRLPSALAAQLLTPFQYFCVSDSVDLRSDNLWSGNKYKIEALSQKLCDTSRVAMIVNTIVKYIADEYKCRALCFCTDKHHAQFMSQAFNEAGLKSKYLTSDTPKAEREKVQDELKKGDINYLCVVDLYNEGVDIPEIDTVLFLRPTESLTIFLQQLGRGLRLSEGKQELTVLDFVARCNRKYDFVSRFRSLFTRKDCNMKEQVENGFSLLPQGCSITLEEKAQQTILENIKSAIYNHKRIVDELRTYEHPSLSSFTENTGQDIYLLYKGNCCWTSLKKEAGKCSYEDDSVTKRLIKGMGYLLHCNSAEYLNYVYDFAKNEVVKHSTDTEKQYALLLYYTLFQDKIQTVGVNDIYEALAWIPRYSPFMGELKELTSYLLSNLDIRTSQIDNLPIGIEQYGCYTREEIFILFGKQTAEKKMQGSVAGIFQFDNDVEAFFVTLKKSDNSFSEKTNYDDYIISEDTFHWQSQNTATPEKAGYKYIYQKELGKRFVLFVRNHKKDGYGNTSPFFCFGLVDYVSSTGCKPMNIIWHLQNPVMPKFLDVVG